MYIPFTSRYGITYQRGTPDGVGLEEVVDCEQGYRPEVYVLRYCDVCGCVRFVLFADTEMYDAVAN